MRSVFPSTPPKIATVPSPYFFVRTVPVAADGGEAAIVDQVELALESISPFPLNQLYYGYWWTAGSAHALVFAAYRRRFTTEQLDPWTDAEIVAPEFASVLAWPASRAETVLLTTESSFVALHWGSESRVPSACVIRAIPADADADARALLRNEVLKEVGESVTVTELAQAPAFEGETGGSEWTVKREAGALTYNQAQLDALDVRDKEDLVARRQARVRDLYLWRGLLSCAALLLISLLTQAGLAGAGIWEKSRQDRIARRAPEVAAINKADELATRIDELATVRLLPFEMLDMVKAGKPASVVFKSVSTQEINTLEVNGTTTVAADLPAYRTVLKAVPTIEKAEFVDQNSRDGVTSFKLQVAFKTDAFKKGPTQ